MSRPQNSFWPHIETNNNSLGPQKVKNNPKIQSKSNVRIEGNKENENYYTSLVDLKTI